MANHDDSDQQLPIANVGRIMKKILPQRAKISKEAKETIKECATEFISFVTSEAAEKCHQENRRTLNGDDIYWAFGNLGLDNYAETSSMYLHKYREAERLNPRYKKSNGRIQDDDDDKGDSSRPNY